jgi:HEPN domain-containing protein
VRAGTFKLGVVPPLTSDIVFHAQQTAEKTMKGFLTWHGRVYRRTHNLIKIEEACAAIDQTREPLLR